MFLFFLLTGIVKEKKIEVVAENKPLKDYERARRTWTIGKFTTLNVSKYDSNPFEINGYTWYAVFINVGNYYYCYKPHGAVISTFLFLQEITSFPKRKWRRIFVCVSWGS